MEAELGRLRGSLAAVGCEDWLLPAASRRDIAAVAEAVAPFHLPAELTDLWALHAGTPAEGDVRDWFIGWSTPQRVLELWEQHKGLSEHFPGFWPYWNEDRWLAIAATGQRDTFFVVLGEQPVDRSVVAVHQSAALDLRVRLSSLRSWVLSLDLLIGTIGDLGLDPRDEELCPYAWWDTSMLEHRSVDCYPDELAEAVARGLPRIAMLDAQETCPEAHPFHVATGEPLGGPWMQALGVDSP